MATTLTLSLPSGSRSDYTSANRRYRTRNLVWSGTYAAGGNSVTAASLGLTAIEEVNFHGTIAAGSTPAKGLGVHAKYATGGTSVTLYLYAAGGGAADDEFDEFDATAVDTGLNIRATFVGH